MLWTILAIALLFLIFDPWTKWRNSISTRARSLEQDEWWVEAVDWAMIFIFGFFSFGLIPSMWNATFMNITSFLGIADAFSGLFWAASMIAGWGMTFMVVMVSKFLWHTVGFYAGHDYWSITTWITRIIAAGLICSVYSLVGSMILNSLASILAISARIPDYDVVFSITMLLSVILTVNGMSTPLSQRETTIIRRIYRLQESIKADQVQIQQYALGGAAPDFLNIWDGPTEGMKYLPEKQALHWLMGRGSEVVENFKDRMVQDPTTGRVYVIPRQGDVVQNNKVYLDPPRY